MAEVAGEVKLILSADGTSWSAELDKAQRALNKLKGATSQAAQVSRAEMTEARHSIHLVTEELGIHLPRALQGFVAKLPGVAEVMASAFSGAAVIGLGMVIIETGKKVYEFIEKQKKAAEEAERATKLFIGSRHLANLEMEAGTAKIEEQIAKLERKPGDALKTALMEARVEAFKLGTELEKDVEEVQKLIEEKIGATWFDRAIKGAAGSEDTLKNLTKYGAEVSRIAKIIDPEKRTAALTSYTGVTLHNLDKELAKRERLQELDKKIADTHSGVPVSPAEFSEALALRREFTGGPNAADQTKAIAGLKLFHEMVEEENRSAEDTADRMAVQADQGRAQDLKNREDLAKQAIEALKRQTAERMEVMKTALAKEKIARAGIDSPMDNEDVLKFWQAQLFGKGGTDPIRDSIAREMAGLSEEVARQRRKMLDNFNNMLPEFTQQNFKETLNNLAPDRAQAQTALQTEGARMAALHDRPELLQQITDAQNELTASELVQSNAMEDHTAKILQQANVLRRLRNELAELEGKRAAVRILGPAQYTPTMNPEVLENQAIQKRAEIQAAGQTLAYSKERDTFGDEMRQMFSDWIKQATDLHAVISKTFGESLSTINSSIVKTMTDPYHRGDWKAAGKSIFSSVAGTGLTMAEGSLMKAFGLGSKKPLGTANDRTFVSAVIEAGSGVGSIASGLASMSANGGFTGTGGSASSSWWGKALGVGLNLLPHLAAGGSLETGMPTVVGERGPELFVPSGSGRIVPNNALGRGTTNYIIDARGATDPAAVRFQVQRGIMEAAPQIAAGSIAASRDMASRKPLMSR